MRGFLVCLLLASAAHAEDDAALLKRAQKAFRNLRSSDEKVTSLRIDATMPFLGGAFRIRIAYQAPERYCMTMLSEDRRCPIGITRDKGLLMYNAARGQMLYDDTTGPPFMRLQFDDDGQLQLKFGFAPEAAEDPEEEESRIRLDFADLLERAEGDVSVRVVKESLVYEAKSERGNRLVAHMTDTADPVLTRLELWFKDRERPFFLVDRIEINGNLGADAFPAIRKEPWKGIAPMKPMFPEAEEDRTRGELQEIWFRRWTGQFLAYGALERALNRRSVLPGADAEEWDEALQRHRKLTPQVLDLWRKEFGPALPAAVHERVEDIDDEAELVPAKPSDEEVRYAAALMRRIGNVRGGPDGVKRLAFEGTRWSLGKPIFTYRCAVDGERYGMQIDSADSSVPVAIADENNALLYDASAGRLLTLTDTRGVAYFHAVEGYATVDLGLDVRARDAPRISLRFKDVLEQYPDARRAFPHPSRKGLVVLEAQHQKHGRIRYLCDPKADPMVREVHTRWRGGTKDVVTLRLVDPQKAGFPRFDVAPFRGVLPHARLDPANPGERWRARWGETVAETEPLIYLTFERAALLHEGFRKYFPQLDKMHWAAFERREKELTPKVTKIWRKAFGPRPSR